jgi:hypothetical protein
LVLKAEEREDNKKGLNRLQGFRVRVSVVVIYIRMSGPAKYFEMNLIWLVEATLAYLLSCLKSIFLEFEQAFFS